MLGVGTAANSIGIGAASNFAHLKLTDSGGTTANLPTTASLLARSALAGHIVFDRSHNLWLGTSGGWRRISGPVTAGSFSIITPIRVYDSRSFSKLDAGTNRLVQVTGLGTIPAGARAISATLTITGTDTSFGFLGITAGDIASTATSAINWFGAGQTMATTVMSALDATGKVKVFNDSPAGANTHFIIDVTGYYL